MSNYLSLDIGGMSIKYGVFTGEGALETSGAFPLFSQESGAETLLHAVKELVLDYKERYKLQGVAMATAGIVNQEEGVVLVGGPHFPGYSGTNWTEFMQKECGLPAAVENDVNALALGEYWQGAAKDKDLVYVLAMGTGIGGALLYKGQLIHGASYSTGEVGYAHMGEKARWEDVASTGALVQQVAAAQNVDPKLLSGQEIFDRAQDGDKIAKGALDTMLARWAEGIANICYMVNPEQIILGGAVAAQEAYLKPLLEKQLQGILLPLVYEATELTFVHIDDKTALLGALYNFLQKHPEKP